MPGTKWWIWRRPRRMLRNGPTVGRRLSAYVTDRTRMNVAANDVRRLNIEFSRVDTTR